MIDITCIKEFSNIVSTIAKLAKHCVLRISQERLFFIIHEAGAVGSSPGLWTELDQGHFFNEFNMEGVSEENNEIYLDLQPDLFSKTLNSLKTTQAAVRSLKVKLSKKHTPCLTLEVELPSVSLHARTVVHDVPVQLIPRRQWHLYKEPEMPKFDASVYLPSLRQVKHVVERMKTLSPNISLSANKRGTLITSVSTDVVSVSTHFKNLNVPVWDEEDHSEDDPEKLHSATVDIKKLAFFLQGIQVIPTKVICNIADRRVIHMFLLNDDVTLQYFLPAAANT